MVASSYPSSSSRNKENENYNYNSANISRQRRIKKGGSCDRKIDDTIRTTDPIRSSRSRRRVLKREEEDNSNKKIMPSLKDQHDSSRSNAKRKGSKRRNDENSKHDNANHLQNLLKRLENVNEFSSLDVHPIDSSKNPTMLLKLLQKQLQTDKVSSNNLEDDIDNIQMNLAIILTMVKRCIKFATATKATNSKKTIIAAHIELSWLGLQTLFSLTMHHPQDLLFWESITKLFYHVIITCCQLYTTSVSSQNDEDTKPNVEDNNDHETFSSTTIRKIAIQAYRSLGEIIQTHFLSSPHSPELLFPTPINCSLSSSMIKIGISCSHAISTILSFCPDVSLSQALSSFSHSSKNYGLSPGSNNEENYENKNKNNIRTEMMFQTISTNITIPWVTSLFSLAANSKKEDSHKYRQEATTHAKRIHKLLWDKASTFSATKSKNDEEVILSLRRDALLSLFLNYYTVERNSSTLIHNTENLLSSPEIPSSSSLPLPMSYIKRNWNQANTLAWKSASMYFSSSSSERKALKPHDYDINKKLECLQQFHALVGNMLDKISLDYFSLSIDKNTINDNDDDDDDDDDNVDMMAYAEYCAIRAFHVGKSSNAYFHCTSPSCTFTKLQYPFVHMKHMNITPTHQHHDDHFQSNDADKATAMCGLFFTTIHLQESLKQTSFQIDNNTYCQFEQKQQYELASLVKTVIFRFVRSFILVKISPNDNALVTTGMDLERCYRLFSILKISNFLHQYIQSRTSSKYHPDEGLLLSLLGQILVQCFIPLSHKLADNNKTNENKFRAIAIEGLLRAATLFDLVADHKQSDTSKSLRLEIQSNSCIYKLFTLFYQRNHVASGQLFSNSTIEMAGKTLANIGKRRRDEAGKTSISCIIPFVFSVDLLSKLVFPTSIVTSNGNGNGKRENRNGNDLKSHQLSLRYSHLSSIFQSLKMWKEAIGSLGLALQFMIVEYFTFDCTQSNKSKISSAEEEAIGCHDYEMNIADMLIICSSHSERIIQKIGRYSTRYNDNERSYFLPIIQRLIDTYTFYLNERFGEEEKGGDENDSRRVMIDAGEDVKFYDELMGETFLGKLLKEICDENNKTLLSLPHLIKKILLRDENEVLNQTLDLFPEKKNRLFNEKMGIVYSILHKLGRASIKSTGDGWTKRKIFYENIDKITQFSLSHINNFTSMLQEAIGKSSNQKHDRSGTINILSKDSCFYDHISAICISAASNLIIFRQNELMRPTNEDDMNAYSKCNLVKLIQIAREKLHSGQKNQVEVTAEKLKYLVYDITLSMMITREYSEYNRDNKPKSVQDEVEVNETTKTTLFRDVSVSVYESILLKCTTAVEMISSLNSDGQVHIELVLSLIVIATEIYHLMSFEGAGMLTAQALKILSALRQFYNSNEFCPELFFGSVLIEGELYECASDLLGQHRQLSFEPRSKLTLTKIAKEMIVHVVEITDSIATSQIDQLQNKISTFIARTLFQCHETQYLATICVDEETQEMMNEIRLICELQQKTIPECVNGFDTVMHRNELIFILCVHWWISTCLLVLSELQEKCGQLQNSLKTIRSCCLHIKRTLNFSRQNDERKISEKLSKSESEIHIDSSTFSQAFLLRVSTCLDRMSFLYSKLGDHRKANGYILSSASTLGVISQSFRIPKNRFFDEVMMLEDVNIRSLRHFRCLRGILFIHSLSVPFSPPSDESYLTTEFCIDKFRNTLSGFSSCNNTVRLNKMDWIREIIQNCIVLGDISPDTSSFQKIISLINCDDEPHVVTKRYSTQALFDLFSEGSFLNTMKNFVPRSTSGNHFWRNNYSSHSNLTFGPTICELKLRSAKLKYQSNSDGEKDKSIELFTDIAESQYASIACRADSYYYLGLDALQKSRENGELYSLWQNHSFYSKQKKQTSQEPQNSNMLDTSFTNIFSARDYFKKAACILGPSSSQLSRKVMRCLALVTGPFKYSESIGLSATVLVHSSIGSTSRQFMSRCNDYDDKIFGAFDEPISSDNVRDEAIGKMFEIGRRLIPIGWNFVAITLCPTGELLVASLATKNENADMNGFNDHILCVFPEKFNEDALGETQVHKEIINALDILIESSKQQLSGMDSTVSCEKYNEEENKRQWWRERKEFDKNLQNLIEFVNRSYFGNSLMHDLFSISKVDTTYENGDSSDESDSNDESYFIGGNLAAKFEAALHVDEKGNSECGEDFSQQKQYLQKKTVVEIKKELTNIGILPKQFRGLRKAELIDLFVTTNAKALEVKNSLSPPSCENEGRVSIDEKMAENQIKDEDKCTFLILDENLHRFPWENMDILSTSTVCRIPSMPFAISTLMGKGLESNQQVLEVNPLGASFVVDPESNLPNTQKKIVPVLEDLSTKNSWKWKGVTGTLPTTEFMTSALIKKRGLFLYCGHGGGERFLSRHQIENLFKNETSFEKNPYNNDKISQQLYSCNSSIILMGCSSGKLNSVNTPKVHNTQFDTHYHYEPEGTALSYLCAGAPCVVSNLWDVTDRDIDRYFVHLLQTFLNDKGVTDPNISNVNNLAACVAKSRSACKMRYIVGCAPVVYGVPVNCEINKDFSIKK